MNFVKISRNNDFCMSDLILLAISWVAVLGLFCLLVHGCFILFHIHHVSPHPCPPFCFHFCFICSVQVSCCCHVVVTCWHQHELAFWLLSPVWRWGWVFYRPACALIGLHQMSSQYFILTSQYILSWVLIVIRSVRPGWVVKYWTTPSFWVCCWDH